jgi:predicted naringenin-chalcone synthase
MRGTRLARILRDVAEVAFFISHFRSIRPAHVRPQARTLEWLCEAHTQAELTRAAGEGRRVEEKDVRSRMRAALTRFGCGEDKISARGYELADCEHTRWNEMEVYRLGEDARGAGALTRTLAFDRIAGSIVERFFEPMVRPPSDLIHVTCTGYTSPSPAQQLVSRRGWGASTRVTHAYHMGCYAAFPALRLACGTQSGLPTQPDAEPRCEVVHTEVCSLHLTPDNHAPEQFVIHSLFADGFVAYEVAGETHAKLRAPGFELLALLERIVPDTGAAMTWRCSDSGMQMSLGRDVPERLSAALGDFVAELVARGGLGPRAAASALFAVHPGGPRILDRVQDLMRLESAQLEHSRKVLRERGNMSSATLPHVWMDMAADPAVPAGAPIVSLAFGPGLTLCGAVLRKVAS